MSEPHTAALCAGAPRAARPSRLPCRRGCPAQRSEPHAEGRKGRCTEPPALSAGSPSILSLATVLLSSGSAKVPPGRSDSAPEASLVAGGAWEPLLAAAPAAATRSRFWLGSPCWRNSQPAGEAVPHGSSRGPHVWGACPATRPDAGRSARPSMRPPGETRPAGAAACQEMQGSRGCQGCQLRLAKGAVQSTETLALSAGSAAVLSRATAPLAPGWAKASRGRSDSAPEGSSVAGGA